MTASLFYDAVYRCKRLVSDLILDVENRGLFELFNVNNTRTCHTPDVYCDWKVHHEDGLCMLVAGKCVRYSVNCSRKTPFNYDILQVNYLDIWKVILSESMKL